jgi:uncharacterized protein YaeQ
MASDMAQNATIFKVTLEIADIDRAYYHDHTLTIARHPSETDERMMVRLLAFARHADEALAFGKGLGTDDEPDLWRKDLTGAIDVWIDVGQPDERRIRRACGRADAVFVYSYGGLTVVNLPFAATQALAKLAQRNMRLHCTMQDGQMWVADSERSVAIEPQLLKGPPTAG